MFKSTIVFLFFLFGFAQSIDVKAQSANQIEILNNYVEFLNTSSHGMGIALLVAEYINCDVNAVHGAPCKNAVPITVDDIPTNLFDRPDDNSSFYEVPPLEWRERAIVESVNLEKNLSSALNEKIIKASDLLVKINRGLYKCSELNKTLKVKKKKNLDLILAELKILEDDFEAFRKLKTEMTELIQSAYPETGSKLYPVLVQYRNSAATLLEGVLNHDLTENDKRIDNYKLITSNVLETLNTIKAAIKKEYPSYNQNIAAFEKKSQTLLDLVKGSIIAQASLEGEVEKEKHAIKTYNQISKLTINQTGPGVSVIFKDILSFLQIKAVNFDEQVVKFKVKYPN